MSRQRQPLYGSTTSRIGGSATNRARITAVRKIASWMFCPVVTSGSPEYCLSASAMSCRNLVRIGMPPGTALRNAAIHWSKVIPVFLIASAITSSPITVW